MPQVKNIASQVIIGFISAVVNCLGGITVKQNRDLHQPSHQLYVIPIAMADRRSVFYPPVMILQIVVHPQQRALS